jgi:hypothetical protein
VRLADILHEQLFLGIKPLFQVFDGDQGYGRQSKILESSELLSF